MRILVTGGAGFIGSHVVDLYLAEGHEVAIIDNLSTGYRRNLNPKAKFFEMDIRDEDLRSVFQEFQPQVVNHHAAQMNVRRSVIDPIFDADVNILGSLKLIELAKEFSIDRFIYISTGGAVYGEPEYLPCDEGHAVNPICQYGASKHTVEHYLYMYSNNYGLNYVVLRYPNVYGPRQDPNGEAGVVAIFTGQMLANDQIIINGDGDQERDFVFVGDCAQANLAAIEVDSANGIYNLGSGKGTSVHQIFIHLRNATEYGLNPIHGPAKIGETRRIYLDASKAAHELGWSAHTTLEMGLAETVEYFRTLEVPA